MNHILSEMTTALLDVAPWLLFFAVLMHWAHTGISPMLRMIEVSVWAEAVYRAIGLAVAAGTMEFQKQYPRMLKTVRIGVAKPSKRPQPILGATVYCLSTDQADDADGVTKIIPVGAKGTVYSLAFTDKTGGNYSVVWPEQGVATIYSESEIRRMMEKPKMQVTNIRRKGA